MDPRHLGLQSFLVAPHDDDGPRVTTWSTPAHQPIGALQLPSPQHTWHWLQPVAHNPSKDVLSTGVLAGAPPDSLPGPYAPPEPFAHGTALAAPDRRPSEGRYGDTPRTQRPPRQRMHARARRPSGARPDDYYDPPSHPHNGSSPSGSTAAALAGDPPMTGGGSREMQGPAWGPAVPPASRDEDDHQHYPIRASIQNRALGLRGEDPLLDDLTAAAELSTDFTDSLDTILSVQLPDPAVEDAAVAAGARPAPSSIFRGPSSLGNRCKGATGIGGSMIPTTASGAPGRFSTGPPQPPTSPPDAGASAPPAAASPVKKEAEESKFQTSFQFVVNETTKDARNTVRKHVMREYRRRERWEQDRRRASGEDPEPEPAQPKRRRKSKATAPSPEGSSNQDARLAQALAEMSSSGSGSPSPTTPSRKRRRVGDHHLTPEGMAELAEVIPNYEEALEELEKSKDLPYMADPYAAVAASDVDPFSRMQMELGPATRSLLHHFAWVMPSLMDEIVTGTVFNRLGWLYSAVAVHDPKPAHVILGFTLGHLAGLRGIAEPALAIEHKNRAFELISARMLDPAAAISDENIGAVVNVAGWELIDCNPEQFAVHMRGLHQMVVGRGGLPALAHNPELQMVLVRLDAIRAYITLSAPRYPTYACCRRLPPLAIPIPPSRGNPTIPPLAAEHPEYSFCEDTFHLVHALEDVLLLLRTVSKENTTAKFAYSVQELVLVTVTNCLSPTAVTASVFATAPSRRVLRLAALVFLDAAVQHFFDGDGPHSGATRLKARFLGGHADKATMAAWGRSLEMVIHVLLAADRLALERPWRAWYFADALTLTMKLGHAKWEEVEAKLTAYLEERCVEGEEVAGGRSRGLWNLKAVWERVEGAWAGWPGMVDTAL